MNYLAIFTQRRIIVGLLLGFASHLPTALLYNTLRAWLINDNLSLKDIGFTGLATSLYMFKFLWALLMDRWVPPLLGRRRGWIFICQLLSCLAIAAMMVLTPNLHPKFLFFLACLAAFTAVSQASVIHAYYVDLLHPQERVLGAAMAVNGDGLAMLLTSGGFALVLAQYYGWQICFLIMMLLMVLSMVVTWMSPGPEKIVTPPKNLRDCIVLSLTDFLKRPQALWLLCFIGLYEFGNIFADAMRHIFLFQEIKMSSTEVASIAESFGFFGTILGTTISGLLVIRLGWFRPLFAFGILQAISNLAYMPLMWTGPDYLIVAIAIFIKHSCTGMGFAALIGLLMALCNTQFAAFQFALLFSLAIVGEVSVKFIKPLIFSIEGYGWISYFMLPLILSIPGLLVLILLKSSLDTMAKTTTSKSETSPLATMPH